MDTSHYEAYRPESASDFFHELADALLYLPDHAKVYNLLNKVFQRCLTQNTAHSNLNLGGTFAKTDYLLKEHHATHELVRKTNNTRVHLQKRHETADSQLQRWLPYDLRNLCLFIAFIYGEEVPESLTARFPEDLIIEERPASTIIQDYIRVIVERWDSDYLYGVADQYGEGNTIQVCYSHVNKPYDFDWSYLHQLLYKSAQVNIIRPHEIEGILYPELIIFEPDYLVDISSIAHSFTSYADSPLVHLLHKLQPSVNTEATVLGNFAGQLLDEQIHQLPDTRTYRESVTDFWQNNSVGLLTANVTPTFHQEAQEQKVNIAQAIGQTLPQAVSSFDPTEGMVEPSFFSEMLGLQGRMDYLQLDFKVLMEQKAGKGDYPFDNFKRPRQKVEHYVQMLLYMMLIRYNFSELYEQNNRELHAFLLYSKYKESLLGLGFAPELIYRAIKLRNELAWSEMRFAQPDQYRILDTLTADALNLKKTRDKLWVNFLSPQITELLAPIHQASPLERAYYYRFLTFISNEHILSKLGNKTKENAGFAAKWHDSLEEKLQAGNIYDRLTLVSPDASTRGNIQLVELQFSDDSCNDMSNFRVGDIVILYPYEQGQEPDARRTMVFRSSIESIEIETIRVQLRAVQTDAKVFVRSQDKPWAIEHDFMESSYSSLYRGMHAFLSAPKSRRDLLLLQRQPIIDPSVTINGEYGRFNELSTRVKRARDLFLIIGPPGTGKTSFGMLNTLKEELTEPQGTVLLLSYTNRAVDEICSKLHADGIDFIRIGGDLTCSEEYHDKLLSRRARQCQNIDQLRRLISTTRVFASTTSSMASNIALLQLKQFSLAIVDEASQILEPHLIGLLSAHVDGRPAISRMVMIGDHKQLPAVVQQQPEVSVVSDPLLNAVHLTDCRLSLFERLLHQYRDDPNVVYMLTNQGRMHQEIASFPSHAFYASRLQIVPLPHQNASLPSVGSSTHGIDNLLQTRRIAFIHADPPEHNIFDKVNQVEADIIAAIVLRIYQLERDHFKADDTVGIIVPYRNQIATIRNTIDRSGIAELHDITIDTVERFQGSQRRYIIYGFTIQHYYQLDFLTNNTFVDWDGSIIDRKLNVAMTRAEEHLILVGNTALLSHNETFARLIRFTQDRQSYYEIPPHQFVDGQFEA